MASSSGTGHDAAAAPPKTTDVPCFVCGRRLDRVGDVPTQPHGGLTFVARGNYGSHIFDPFSTLERLHIIVCDECAEERATRIVAVMERHVRPSFEYRSFESFKEFKEELIPDA